MIYTLNLLIICLVLFKLCDKIIYNFQQYKILNKYKNYQDILNSYLETSYDTIYKEQILSYHLDTTQVDSDTLETIKRNYIKLTFEVMGDNITQLLIEYYCSKKVMISNMLLYFQSRLDNDTTLEIMKNRQSAK